jgi:hypothetical protein
MWKHVFGLSVKSEHARGSNLLGNAIFVQFTRKRAKLGNFRVMHSAAPQRGMLPEISHAQALLGALVKCFLKILVQKIIRRFYFNL